MNKMWTMGLVLVLGISTVSQAAISHVMTASEVVFFDDFEDGSYTDKWSMYYDEDHVWSYTEENGYLQAQNTSGKQYNHVYLFSKTALDISPATGKKTEFVAAQCNLNAYSFNRTFLTDGGHPWTKGFAIEHQRYPNGHIVLSLYNGGGMAATLYDSGPMASYQYDYSTSLIVDPATGEWSFGWADGVSGVTTTVASGTLTAEQKATYLSNAMYIGTGIYTGHSTDKATNYNRTYEVAAYQVPEPVSLILLGLGGMISFLRKK